MPSSQECKTRYFDRPGGRIAFDVTGPADGPLVVCVPGMGDLRSTYRHLRPALTGVGCRVAVMDLRGHGDSDATFDAYDDEAAASDVVALIKVLGGPATLIGNSMGAGAATIAAAAHPQLVTALVLIGPFVRNVPSGAVTRWALRLAMAGPWSTRIWLSYLPRLYPTRRGEDFDQHVKDVGMALRRPGRAAAFRRTTRTDHTQAWQAAGKITLPTLVVMGSKDPDFPDPAEEAHLVARTMSGRTLIVPGGGHYPQSEFPEVTGPAVVNFIAHAVHRA
jgi:pimeloyl-ACP methyl ester carboxylesterase